jgi:hypothetical protein
MPKIKKITFFDEEDKEEVYKDVWIGRFIALSKLIGAATLLILSLKEFFA